MMALDNDVKSLAKTINTYELLGVHEIKTLHMVSPKNRKLTKWTKLEKALHVDTLGDRIMSNPKLIKVLKRCNYQVDYSSQIYHSKKQPVQGIVFNIKWGNHD